MQIEGLEKLERLFQSLPDKLEGGVKVLPPASAYALVWEWGSARISKPGPKTTWGTNPDGEQVILTLTAPNGYIRVNREAYLQILLEEFGRVGIGSVPPAEWAQKVKEAVDRASERCASVIREHAPEDTGQLKSDIVPVEVDDPILSGTGTEFDLGVVEL